MNKILIAIQIILFAFLAGCADKSDYVGDLVNELPHGKGMVKVRSLLMMVSVMLENSRTANGMAGVPSLLQMV